MLIYFCFIDKTILYTYEIKYIYKFIKTVSYILRYFMLTDILFISDNWSGFCIFYSKECFR